MLEDWFSKVRSDGCGEGERFASVEPLLVCNGPPLPVIICLNLIVLSGNVEWGRRRGCLAIEWFEQNGHDQKRRGKQGVATKCMTKNGGKMSHLWVVLKCGRTRCGAVDSWE